METLKNENYQKFIDESYGHPAQSHQEVWALIAVKLRSYLKRCAVERGFKWIEENKTFASSFQCYLDACETLGRTPLELGEFREKYYRYNEFNEYRQ